MAKRLKRNPEREVVFHAVLDATHSMIGKTLSNGMYLTVDYNHLKDEVTIRVTQRVDGVPDSG